MSSNHIYGMVTLDDLRRHLGSDADLLAETVLTPCASSRLSD